MFKSALSCERRQFAISPNMSKSMELQKHPWCFCDNSIP